MKDKKHMKQLRLSPMFLGVGSIGIIFFSLIWFMSVQADGIESLWNYSLYGFFIILGIFLILLSVNCRIYYNEQEFTIRNILGIEHTYKYEDITEMEVAPYKVSLIKIGNTKYAIEYYHTGGRFSFGSIITGNALEFKKYAIQGIKDKYGDDYTKIIKFY